jgi:A/G-specific adenine glycosylase
LFEPPTSPIPASSTKEQRSEAALESISQILQLPKSEIKTHHDVGSIPHIFSHINMTYHVQHLQIESTKPPPELRLDRAVWLDDSGVESANIGTGVKKVWAEVFGSWGNFEPGVGTKKPKAVKRKSEVKIEPVKNGEKVVKKIMMPMMPSRAQTSK